MTAPSPPDLDQPGLAELASWALAAPRTGRRLVIGAALALAGLLGALVLAAGAITATSGNPMPGEADCVPEPTDPVPGVGAPPGPAGGAPPVTPEQQRNAAIIVSTGRSLGVPTRGLWIGLATAMQESGLRNLPSGDRDSLGLFQQRPSAGWGTPAQILDPAYAATQFFKHLLAVPGWQSMPLTQAAQAVQRSAFPNAYARWEGFAARLLASVGGAVGIAPPAPCQPALPTDPATAGQQVGAVLTAARAQLGKPYQWGATGPNAFDCSGFTLTAWKAAGVMLPRTAAAQATAGPHIPLSQLQPGDLLFWSYNGTIPGIHHVAIYAGGGQILEAADTGIPVRTRPVRLPGPTGTGGEAELMPFAVRPAPQVPAPTPTPPPAPTPSIQSVSSAPPAATQPA